jgi:hypothetical protein
MGMGMGIGCVATPLSAACVQSVAPHRIARATTLLGVNDQVGGAVGAALMALLLNNQRNRHEDMVAANKLAALQEDASRRGVPVDPSAIPPPTLVPDFASTVSHHCVHAYAMVSVAAAALAISSIIPVAFLPRKPAWQKPTGRGLIRPQRRGYSRANSVGAQHKPSPTCNCSGSSSAVEQRPAKVGGAVRGYPVGTVPSAAGAVDPPTGMGGIPSLR